MVVAFSSGLAGDSRSGSFNPYSLILRSRVRVLIPRRSAVKLSVAAGLEQALLDRLAFQVGECGARYNARGIFRFASHFTSRGKSARRNAGSRTEPTAFK